MKHLALLLLLFNLISCKTIKNLEPSGEPLLKRVQLDEFMNNQLQSVPISFLIPKAYQYADIDAPLNYSYWMPIETVQKVKKTKNMPLETGWMYGKVSMSVGYNAETDKFIGAENLAHEAKMYGFTNVKSERMSVSGHPILTIQMEHEASGKTIYSMYIGMKIETNVIFLSYREPKGEKAVGRYVWNNLIASMKSSNNS